MFVLLLVQDERCPLVFQQGKFAYEVPGGAGRPADGNQV
ncbi:hypothetical protein J2Z49_000101 [Desulfofundulus luciae]|uniref:NUDIX hydrolase n=1 Tax=Desulfofundulus luciae TaxID=74702 RepID=A0ABU0AX26_9FIRM|nr:hypothetical protein [Desulfofundulus luciae]